MTVLTPVLNPHGVLSLKPSDDGSASSAVRDTTAGAGVRARLGARTAVSRRDEVGTALPPVLSYWREFGARYVTALCALPGHRAKAARKPPCPVPADGELDRLAAAVPPMTGAEYLTAAGPGRSLARHGRGVRCRARAKPKFSVQEFLKRRHPAWNLVGRVHFNLAENRKDEEAPFAFLATYTTRLSAQAKAQHLPLGKALQEYAGAKNRERLLSLLMPVQRAAEQCAWLKAMVDAGEIYHPLRWTPAAGAAIAQGRARARSAPASSCGCRRAGA